MNTTPIITQASLERERLKLVPEDQRRALNDELDVAILCVRTARRCVVMATREQYFRDALARVETVRGMIDDLLKF